ncbi:MAG: metallophosphoesterase [Pseudomonadota bacterium]
MSRLRIAHLSDPHLGPLPRPPLRALLSKRMFGYANWLRSRARALVPGVLEALQEDLYAHRPDHICVTGDLVNIAMAHEYDTAARFLAALGNPDDVSCVPGNHDAYVPGGAARAASAWAAHMSGDDGRQRFPFLRRRGGVALIGVSTAIATPPFSARGRVGREQRAALRTMLDKADDAFKVVLIHHPPDRRLTPWRRALADGRAVADVLSDGCANLVLHGHNHEASEASLRTATGKATLLGVPSASSDGVKHPPAGYALIDIDTARGEVRVVRRAMVGPSAEFGQVARFDL